MAVSDELSHGVGEWVGGSLVMSDGSRTSAMSDGLQRVIGEGSDLNLHCEYLPAADGADRVAVGNVPIADAAGEGLNFCGHIRAELIRREVEIQSHLGEVAELGRNRGGEQVGPEEEAAPHLDELAELSWYGGGERVPAEREVGFHLDELAELGRYGRVE